MPLIYESPDGGDTVYARESGHTDRQLIKTASRDPYEQLYLWHDIVQTAKTNPALHDALDHVLLLYKLIKEPS